MTDPIQTRLPADPRFANVPRNPAHQKDLEDIRKWTRECQTNIALLVKTVNALQVQIDALAKP